MNEQKSNNLENNSPDLVDLPMVTPTESTTNLDSHVGINPNHKNVLVRNYAIATLIVLLMGGGLWLILEKQERVNTNFLSMFANRGPVATVNGEKISREAYEKNREQVRSSAEAQGVDVTQPEIATEIDNQALETLINTELLKQKAQELGIVVTDEEIKARYDQLVEQLGGEETLNTRMAELGIDSDGLHSDIESELVIQKLFAQAVDTSTVEVTEEEIAEVFAQASAGGEEVKVTLDDVREVIETNIRSSKEQELITQYIQTLRAEADIKITS